MVHGQSRGSNGLCEHHRTAGSCFLLLPWPQQATPTPCTMGSWASECCWCSFWWPSWVPSVLWSPWLPPFPFLLSGLMTSSSTGMFQGCPCTTFWRQHHRSRWLEGAPRGQRFNSSLCLGAASSIPALWGICAFEWTYFSCLKRFWNFCK